MARIVACTARGQPIGEDHPKAVLSNAEVDLLFRLREETGLGYAALAAKFEISKASVADILKCRRRNATPESFKAHGA